MVECGGQNATLRTTGEQKFGLCEYSDGPLPGSGTFFATLTHTRLLLSLYCYQHSLNKHLELYIFSVSVCQWRQPLSLPKSIDLHDWRTWDHVSTIILENAIPPSKLISCRVPRLFIAKNLLIISAKGRGNRFARIPPVGSPFIKRKSRASEPHFLQKYRKKSQIDAAN